MDSNSNKYQVLNILGVLLILILGIGSFNHYTNNNGSLDNDEKINLVKKNIELEDDKKIKELSEKFEEVLKNEKISKELDNVKSDTTKEELRKALNKNNVKLKQLYESDLDSIQSKKNKKLIEFEENNLKKDRINYWLIALIILTAGILGGWARINYGLLAPIKNNIEEMTKKMIDIYEKHNNIGQTVQNKDFEADFKEFTVKVDKETNEIKEKINSLLKGLPSKKDRVYTSIVFGVIASTISLLALKLTESNILEFNNNIDYFLLWAWCVLGAVFAKDSIENFYNSNKK
jgi:hypothetical protein